MFLHGFRVLLIDMDMNVLVEERLFTCEFSLDF